MSSRRLACLLCAPGGPITSITMNCPNEIHNLARYAAWLEFFHAAAGYFEQHLERRVRVKPQ